jgi:hypothetical protein
MGLGGTIEGNATAVIPLRELSDRLAAALVAATTDPALYAGSARLADRMQLADEVGTAGRLVDQSLNDKS